jgi:hypothetical protein
MAGEGVVFPVTESLALSFRFEEGVA